MATPGSSAIDAMSRQIIDLETAGSEEPALVAEGLERTLRHLQELFTKVIGPPGFQGVLDRAVHLARPDCRWLQQTDVVIDPQVTMVDLAATAQREGAAQVKAGGALVVSCFVALLATFIGEELRTRRRWSGCWA